MYVLMLYFLLLLKNQFVNSLEVEKWQSTEYMHVPLDVAFVREMSCRAWATAATLTECWISVFEEIVRLGCVDRSGMQISEKSVHRALSSVRPQSWRHTEIWPRARHTCSYGTYIICIEHCVTYRYSQPHNSHNHMKWVKILIMSPILHGSCDRQKMAHLLHMDLWSPAVGSTNALSAYLPFMHFIASGHIAIARARAATASFHPITHLMIIIGMEHGVNFSSY